MTKEQTERLIVITSDAADFSFRRMSDIRQEVKEAERTTGYPVEELAHLNRILKYRKLKYDLDRSILNELRGTPENAG